MRRLHLLQSTGSGAHGPQDLGRVDSVVGARGLSGPEVCGIFSIRESNLCLLYWQADSSPLSARMPFTWSLLVSSPSGWPVSCTRIQNSPDCRSGSCWTFVRCWSRAGTTPLSLPLRGNVLMPWSKGRETDHPLKGESDRESAALFNPGSV